ncbi:helix-turn-helix domain-containing protein [Streptomyces sp. NBC_00335]|uniref:nSTAND1 domain-containing NTPase n=1 Tax=unclassified Streptomyces TaxID=2593676 RepID=UPI002254B163|nr:MULTISPECIES: helix-turn-helix domain-containing protein [unclassified Streptomyces]MCX5402704.1 helix-turn-helix domain-containing protein [Streptomyces sp. NBC_00086]
MGDVLGDPERASGTAAAFPAQLRRLRVQRGLSLGDLARQTHYSKGYLSKIETGAKPVTLDVARSCDRALGAEGELLRLVPESEDCGTPAGPRTGPAGRSGPPGPLGTPSTPGTPGTPGPPAAPGPPRQRAPQSDGACPYRGLSAFTPQDAQWFFGRERATAALVERVHDRLGHGPLLLVARSGAGKSSLLSAGLVPALRRGGFPVAGADGWPAVRFTPTAHPLRELLEATVKAVGGDLGVTPAQLSSHPELLLESVHRLTHGAGLLPGAQRRQLPTVRPVLLVDQFEELFTLCSDEEERRAFVRVLLALATAPPGRGYDPAVVVLGVRADFSGECLDLPELAAVFSDGLFVLPPMSVAELRESITRPAELAGLVLEPGLVPLLLRDAGVRDPAAGDPGAGDPVARPGGGPPPEAWPGEAPSSALPLMSHALMATWQRREGSTLTVAGYEYAGGIQGAVARSAEQVFARLYPAEQRMVRRLLVRLVHLADGTGPTRRRMSRTALLEGQADTARAAAALDAFVRARLISADSETVEITHEALLHAWPRLRGWIHADRAGLLVHQQLAQAADEWVREARDPSVLYRGSRLATARAWADELDGRSRLGPREAAFLDASRAAEEARRRQDRLRVRLHQRMLATLVVLLLLALTAGAVAYQQRAGALGQERTARSQALAARSLSLAAGQPEASMLLAEEAYRAKATPEARGALLSTQSQPFLARLGGHGGPVNAVAFAPDGRLLATAGSDGKVLLRRVADRSTVAAFTAPGRVRTVAFSPDGRTLAAGSTDGPVRLWPVGAGGGAVSVLPASTAGARAVAFAPDGDTLAIAAADGTIQLRDPDGEHGEHAVLTGHTARVNALAYAPDGRSLVSAGADGTVRLWDTRRAEPAGVLEGHTGEVLGAAFAPDGRTVATGGVDRTVRLWDVGGRRAAATLAGHSDDVNSVAYTPDGTTVISGGGDGTTRLWDVRSGRLTATLAGHTDYVLAVSVDPAGSVLATAAFDQSVVLWDLRGPVLTARPFTEVWHATYSPDGKLLATADADHTVLVWDVAGRRVLATFSGHAETVFSVAFAPDGRTLASAGADGTVRLWDTAHLRDTATRAPLATLTGHTGTVFSVAFAPDGRTLASAGADGTVRLWDTATRSPLATLIGHTDFANDVVFSPDGRTLASAGDDLTVRLWDVAGRRPLAALSGHAGAVRAVAFGPDGRTLASSGNDGTVRLWDAEQRRVTAVLTGHTGSARGIAFSPDGRTLASSGNDRTVRLWDVPGHRLRAMLSGHTNAVWGVVFSPDGRTLASSSNDGTVRLWNPDPGARLADICRTVGRLGPRERQALVPGLPVRGCRPRGER